MGGELALLPVPWLRTDGMAKLRILLIGPLPIEGDVIGGTSVSFERLVEGFSASDCFDVDVINTSRPTGGHGLLVRGFLHAWTFARMMWRLIRIEAASDVVMLNASFRGLLFAGPVVWLTTRWFRQPLIVRVFGGDFGLQYDRRGPFVRWLASKTFMRSELFLLQTKELCAKFSSARWFPTTRDLEAPTDRERVRCRRFVFISQLRPEKGWQEAVQASKSLPAGCSLTVYGPVMPDTNLSVFEGAANASYLGPLQPQDVPRILAEHDALVFPTYYSGEGIPGIVIEALQAGLPVIASRWGTIPELIQEDEEEVSGLLVEPRSVDELATAMKRLVDSPQLLREMSKAALRRGCDFRTSDWQQQLELWCHAICGVIPNESTQSHRKAA